MRNNSKTPVIDRSVAARAKRWLAVATAATLSLFALPATPGDLDDFFNSAGAQYNITPAGVYQSSTLNVASGGSFVFHAPRKDFKPFYVSPPSLKYGCGGIDFFLGSFGIPSKTEFVNFIKSIGTAMPGLAFQLALQSLSPDFEKQLTSFRNMLQKITAESIGSCEAASALLDKTGAATVIKAGGEAAAGGILQTLGVNSGTEARNSVRGDWSNIAGWFNGKSIADKQGTAADGSNSGVNRVSPTANVFWSTLNAGKFASMTTADKELLMSSVNNWVYQLADPTKPTDPDNTPWQASYPQLVRIDDLLGQAQAIEGSTVNVDVWQCDDTTSCLNPSQKSVAIVPMAQRVYDAARKIQSDIASRTRTYTSTDLMLVSGSSSVPLLRLINATTFSSYQSFSDDLLRTYAELAAHDLVLEYLRNSYDTVDKLLKASPTQNGYPTASDIMGQMTELERQKKEVDTRRQTMYSKVQQINAVRDMMDAVDLAVTSRLTTELRNNMAFGSGRSSVQ